MFSHVHLLLKQLFYYVTKIVILDIVEPIRELLILNVLH